MMTSERRRKLTEPLSTITIFFGTLLLIAILAGAAFALAGSGSFGGFGGGLVCATQPNAGYDSAGTAHPGVSARPGASIEINGTLQACANHASIGQRILETMTSLPGLLVWGCVLFLLWRMLVAAGRTGPFTTGAATAMRRLGWLIIVGSVVAGAVQGFALDQLLNTMIAPRDDFGDAITGAVHGLLPVPALAGAALLTIARIIRLGAEMDDEIQGTV
jgi:hypothetical protein